MNRWRQVGGSAAWGIADQALSSLTNFALGIVAAHELAAFEFGAFSIAFLGYTMALGLYRAIAAHPLVARYTDSSEDRRRRGVASATGTVVVVAIACGFAGLFAAFIAGGSLAEALLALALVLPGLLLQDSWRFWFFAAGSGAKAFTNDLAWAVLLVPTVAALLWTDHVSVGWLILAWGGCATAAALLGIAQSKTMPRPGDALRWLREHHDLAPRYVGEFIARLGQNQLAIFGIGAVAGLEAVGALRAAWIALGPLNVFFMANGLVAVPEGIRILRKGPEGLRRVSFFISCALGIAAAIWGLAVLLLPSGIGEEILQSNWAAAQPVLPALVIAGVGNGIIVGAEIGLRALAAAGRILRASAIVSAVATVSGVAGAAIGGVQDAAWGFALASLAGSFVWWRELLKAIGEVHPAETHPVPASRVMRNAVSPANGIPDAALRTLAHFLPNDATFLFRADGYQSWANASGGSNGEGGKKVLVLSENGLSGAPDIDAFAGLVLLGRHRFALREINRLGFVHIREFAVVPSLRDPRWFIPLDSRVVAGGAFRLHFPYRPPARMKHLAARAAARVGLPIWYRDRICIAQRSRPELEQVLQEIFGDEHLRVGVAAGTPGGFPKPSFVVLDSSGGVRAFGKVASTPLRSKFLRREAEALSHLASLPGARLAPKLIFQGDADGHYVTLQEALVGAPGSSELHKAHNDFLNSLVRPRLQSAAATEFVRSLQSRIEKLPLERSETAAFFALRPTLNNLVLPSTIVHGDFAPWNLRRANGRISAFDWEWWSPDGLPLIDWFHHQLQVGFLLTRWDVERAHGYVALQASTRPLGLPPTVVQTVAALGLMSYVLRVTESGYSEVSPLITQYRQLISRLVESIRAEQTVAIS